MNVGLALLFKYKFILFSNIRNHLYFIRVLRVIAFYLIVILQISTVHAEKMLPSDPNFSQVLDNVFPSVVNISITVTEHEINDLEIRNSSFPSFFKIFHYIDRKLNLISENKKEHFKNVGSGVIIDKDNGYIITNHHVIKNSSEIFVTLYDKRRFKAQLVGIDDVTDIAILKIDNNNLSQIKFADTKSVKIGNFVAAIGHPLQLEYTATFGIISGLNRSNLGIEKYENFIQTDAAVNVGNSGGALINLKGQLVGINTANIHEIGGSGFGFAIPIETIETISKKIIKYGKIQRGRVGMSVKNIPIFKVQDSNTSLINGVFVEKIEKNGPADVAGLKVGDVIISMDNKSIHNMSHVRNILVLKCVNENVDIKFLRNTIEQNTILTIK